MVAQHMAAMCPRRLHTLTSIMSSSGARDLEEPEPGIRALLDRTPAPGDNEAAIEHTLALWTAISSPAFPTEPADLQAFVHESARRCRPGGKNETRQLAAIIADRRRVAMLRGIRVPTLVVHGDADPLVAVEGGIDTARHIPNARLEIIAGMGHDLPRQLLDPLCRMLTARFEDREENVD